MATEWFALLLPARPQRIIVYHLTGPILVALRPLPHCCIQAFFEIPALHVPAPPPAARFRSTRKSLATAELSAQDAKDQRYAVRPTGRYEVGIEGAGKNSRSGYCRGQIHVARVNELEQTLDTTKSQLSQLHTDYSELESAYETVRVELASNRVSKSRSERVTERVAQVRSELAAEVQRLQARLIELDAPAMDISTLSGERNEYRDMLRSSVERFVALISTLTGQTQLPQPPSPGVTPEQRAALEAWFKTIEHQTQIVAEGLSERELIVRSLRSRLAAASRRIKVLEAASTQLTKAPRQTRVTLKVPADTSRELKDWPMRYRA